MRFQIYLDLSPTELARYYQGRASAVRVRARNGARIQFPAAWLRAHVQRHGVQGWFELETDAQQRLRSFRRLPAQQAAER